MNEHLELLEKQLKKIKIKNIPNTFLNIIGKSRDEVILSSIVAFLLNPKETCSEILEKILEHTSSKNDEADFLELFRQNDDLPLFIQPEKAISERSRLDIIIQFSSFWIVIENKINAQEHNKQSLRYEEDLKQQTSLPIKYICLKPNYNQCELENKHFVNFTYGELIAILKQISIYQFQEKENYRYMEDFIKHVEGYLMNEKELEISEDIEFYIEHQDIINQIQNNYQKQCNILAKKLEEKIQEKLGPHYQTYLSPSMKWQYLQVWKENWDNTGHSGLHYEIWRKH